MTGTEKTILPGDASIYSMDDPLIFGKMIDSKTTSWAIENKKITDYNVLILQNKRNSISNRPGGSRAF